MPFFVTKNKNPDTEVHQAQRHDNELTAIESSIKDDGDTIVDEWKTIEWIESEISDLIRSKQEWVAMFLNFLWLPVQILQEESKQSIQRLSRIYEN